ncbi:MAG: rhodanese-like domain-containing protein [Pseudomonadota bacterium]
MTGRLAALLVSVLAFAASPAVAEPQALPPEITALEASELMDTRGIVLIDVREPEELAASGRASGAHAIPLQAPDFIDQVTALIGDDRSVEVAFICRSGRRSLAARDRLIAAGYPNATSVAGGTLAPGGWQAAGLPMTSAGE